MANNASSTSIPLIMTRPRAASEAFLAGLDPSVRARFAPVISPLIDIVHLNVPVDMSDTDAAIFSSANGVHAAPDGQRRTAYCVGSATTRAATDKGWAAIQSGQDAASLVGTLLTIKPRARLFHLSGAHTRGDIAGHLTRAGLRVEHVALYDQRLCALTPEAASSLEANARVIVPLFSPRTAAQFANVAPRTTCVIAIALSTAVADALGSLPLAGLTIAKLPNAQSMGAALGALT